MFTDKIYSGITFLKNRVRNYIFKKLNICFNTSYFKFGKSTV